MSHDAMKTMKGMAAVKNVEQKLSEDGKRLPSKCDTPMKLAYRPELDDTAELFSITRSLLAFCVGQLSWVVLTFCMKLLQC